MDRANTLFVSLHSILLQSHIWSQHLRLTQAIFCTPQKNAMTTAYEHTGAIVWAGGFLIELARDKSLPFGIRQRVVMAARHFPTLVKPILSASLTQHGCETALTLPRPKEEDDWTANYRHRALTSSTQLEWPEE